MKEDNNSEESDMAEKGDEPEGEGENDKKIAEMLQLSQEYLERNCNAMCNNLSLLTLHTF